jgi:hypothetical protein
MTDISTRQFGLLIAYILPGFLGLLGLAPSIPLVSIWLASPPSSELGVGAPLYALLAATTLGMSLSCLRWLLIDTIHHRTGVHPPTWNDARLDASLEAFDYLVENHYRYYQFYANAAMAVCCGYLPHRLLRTSPLLGAGTDLGALITCAVLFAGSRDALAKYYTRTDRLIGQVAEKEHPMTNGNHEAEASGATQNPQPMSKPLPHKTSTKNEPKGKPNAAK